MRVEQSQRIEELYHQMFEMLMAYARCSLGNEALAEEAVQETFRVACQRPDQLCGSENPRGWLVVTLKNTIHSIQSDRTKAKKLLERYLATRVQTVSFSEDRLGLHVLYENVADTEEFRILAEFVLEGKTHMEMAQARGITVSACKKRIQRAKESLQKKIYE